MTQQTLSVNREPQYLIWSNEWQSYWRANGANYTTDLLQAGRYTKAEAERRCFASIRTSDGTQQKDIYFPAPDRGPHLYVVLAHARAARWGYTNTLDGPALTAWICEQAADANLRADVNTIVAALKPAEHPNTMPSFLAPRIETDWI